jgi:hypothetical protein
VTLHVYGKRYEEEIDVADTRILGLLAAQHEQNKIQLEMKQRVRSWKMEQHLLLLIEDKHSLSVHCSFGQKLSFS